MACVRSGSAVHAAEVATFAGGCFWCTEAVFQELRGVVQVLPGYAGGSVEAPTYEQVRSAAFMAGTRI